MDTDTLWLVLRVLDILLLGAVVSGVFMHWRQLKLPDWSWFGQGMAITFAAGMYGNIGRLMIFASGGPWIIALTVGYSVLAVGCYRKAFLNVTRRILTKLHPDRSAP